MKKFAVILVLVLLAGSFAYAHNEAVTCDANFTCKVIKALSWTDPSNVTLPDVIKGQSRTISNSVSFVIAGEASYDVTITGTGPSATSDGVVLNGSWTGTGTVTLNTTGNATATYTCSSIDASASGVTTGDKTFTVSVSAVYTSI